MNLQAQKIENNSKIVSQCPVTTSMEVIGGKWKVIIIYQLKDKTLRFGELKALIPGISQKVLTAQLRELEKDNIISRKVYAQVPPKVEYQQTDLAVSLNPIIEQLCNWGAKFREQL